MKRTNQITTNYIMQVESIKARCEDVLNCSRDAGIDLSDFMHQRDKLDRATKEYLLYASGLTTPEEATAIQAYLKGEIK